MSRVKMPLRLIAAAIGVCALSACASLDQTPLEYATPAAKVDSGLGDLPHYRDWVDTSGRTPMQPVASAQDATRWP